MALLPVALLTGLSVRRHPRDAAWWWLAGAFFISWIADTVADLVPKSDTPYPTLVYPVVQSTIIGAVLLPRRAALLLLAGLAIGAAVVIVRHGGRGPDAILHTAASLAVLWIVCMRKELPVPLRACLLIYFGLGLITWLVHVEWLVVATWYPYQAARLLGLLLFCWAAYESGPHLRVIRA